MAQEDWWTKHEYPLDDGQAEETQLPSSEHLEAPSEIPRTLRAVQNPDSNRHGRTIIICLDGTGDKFDDDNTNIVHLVSCLKKDNKSQTTYYQAGIGTYSNNGLITGVMSCLDSAVGSLLGLHIRDAYNFLIHTHREGDKICIFGFSRGAYTGRCLAGMIHKVGLLPPRNVAQIPFAYDIYKDDSAEGWKRSAEFKKTFCVDVNVYFLGLFDTVDSVGLLPRELPFNTGTRNRCRYFRHAMALDERRAKFQVRQYYGKEESTADPFKPSKLAQSTKTWPYQQLKDPKAELLHRDGHEHDSQKTQGGVKGRMQLSRGGSYWQDTDVLEVWFAGGHANCGGGAVRNEERHKLSNIPLRWLIRQCFECNTGILFNTDALAEQGLDIHLLWPQYKKVLVPGMGPSPSLMEQYKQGLPAKVRRSSILTPLKGNVKKHGFYCLEQLRHRLQHMDLDWLPEQMEDCFDALADPYDALTVAKKWWILELWPIEYSIWNENRNTWDSKWGLNLARSRPVRGSSPLMHWTVRYRMMKLGYTTTPRMQHDALWHVVA